MVLVQTNGSLWFASRFKSLLLSPGPDGNHGNRIEISDVKYSIFQVAYAVPDMTLNVTPHVTPDVTPYYARCDPRYDPTCDPKWDPRYDPICDQKS